MQNQRSFSRLLLYQSATDMKNVSVSKLTVTRARIMLHVFHPFQVLAVIKTRIFSYNLTADNLKKIFSTLSKHLLRLRKYKAFTISSQHCNFLKKICSTIITQILCFQRGKTINEINCSITEKYRVYKKL